MVRCGLGMQQCAMHNATIQKTIFFELGDLKEIVNNTYFLWRTNLGSIPGLAMGLNI